MVITDLSICCHWRIECDCVSERQISGLGCFCVCSWVMHLIWQKKCDCQSFTFFFSFIFWAHWHLTHQVLIWINSFPSYLLINSCSSGQCDWLWPNQKMEYLMNIKMMNTMRGNKSIHPSYSAYPVQGGGGGTGFHGLRVNAWKATTLCRAFQTDSQSYFQTYGTCGQFRYHQLCKHACLWTAGRNGSVWREPTQAHGEHANLHRKAPNCFWIKRTGRHFLLKLSVSQIFILHKKPQTNATFVITGWKSEILKTAETADLTLCHRWPLLVRILQCMFPPPALHSSTFSSLWCSFSLLDWPLALLHVK